jgi:transcriptional regulator with XRE-family HTH domain
MANTTGSKLKSARVKMGLSQAELAEKIGVSQAAIGQWERGLYEPRGKNIIALNETLGLEGDGAIKHESVMLTEDIVSDEGVIVRDFEADALTLIETRRIRFKQRELRTRISSFSSQVEALLVAKNIKAHRLLVDGSDNRMWVVDLATKKSVIQFVHPTSYVMIERWIHSALWRLVVLRKILGEKLNYVVVVSEPPPVALETDNEAADEWLTIGQDRIDEIARDAELVGLSVFSVKSPDQAATLIHNLETMDKK